MEHGDIGSSYTQRAVVILESMFVFPPRRRGKLFAKSETNVEYAQRCEMSDKMCSWIVWYGRTFSVGIELWSMLPQDMCDILMGRVIEICDDYVVETHVFSGLHAAYLHLQMRPEIGFVADSDVDRREMYWKMRGLAFQSGTTP